MRYLSHPFFNLIRMKIQTNNIHNFNRKVIMMNQEVSWGKNGIAEVEDSLGKKLAANFEDIFKEGEVPVKKNQEVVEDNENPTKEVQKLKVKISDLEIKATHLQSENTSLKKQLDISKADAGSWKEEYEKLLKVSPIQNETKKEPDIEPKGGEYEAQLNEMKVDELKAIAEEMGVMDNVEDKRKPEAFIKAILEADKDKTKE